MNVNSPRSPIPLLRTASAWLLASAGLLGAQDRTLVAYDVRSLLAPEVEWLSGQWAMPREADDEVPRTGRRSEGPVQALTAERLLEILRIGLGPAGNGTGEPMLTMSGEILFASATADEHRRVEACLELCQRVFLEHVAIEIHLLPASILAGAEGRLLRDEVDSLLRSADAHACYTRSARVASSVLLRSDDGLGFVRDFDTEVAQKGAINDPKIDIVVSGRAWAIQTARCADGRLLVHVEGQAADRVGEMRTLEIPHRDLKGKPQRKVVQLPVLRVARDQAVGRLADGEALVFGGADGDGLLACLRIRRTEAVPAPAGPDWAWCFTGDLTTPRQRSHGAHLRLPVPGDDFPLFDTVRDPATTLTTDDLITAVRGMAGLIDPDQVRVLPGQMLCFVGSAPARKAAVEATRSLASSLVRDVTVEVRCGRLDAREAVLAAEGRLDPGELAGRMPVAMLVGSLLDHDFGRTAIVQHAYLRDYEVEIAQESDQPNAVIGTVDSGLAIHGRVHAVALDRYRLSLDVSFAEPGDELQLLDLKDEQLGPVELPNLRTMTFAVHPIVDAKRWTLIHLAPLHGKKEHFVCVARVQE